VSSWLVAFVFGGSRLVSGVSGRAGSEAVQRSRVGCVR
jgi:hypothetical protein